MLCGRKSPRLARSLQALLTLAPPPRALPVSAVRILVGAAACREGWGGACGLRRLAFINPTAHDMKLSLPTCRHHAEHVDAGGGQKGRAGVVTKAVGPASLQVRTLLSWPHVAAMLHACCIPQHAAASMQCLQLMV